MSATTDKATQMDWQQVALNGGPPCFAKLDDEDGWYCGRAERWEGHDGEHQFVSLAAFRDAAYREGVEDAAKVECGFCKGGIVAEWTADAFRHHLNGETPWVVCRANSMRVALLPAGPEERIA